MPNYPDPQPPYDRTGAGDAFASTTVAALALGEPLEVALRWAPINSMSVVQKLGAQAGLLRREEIEQFMADAPEFYHPEEIQ
jgi:ribokinase